MKKIILIYLITVFTLLCPLPSQSITSESFTVDHHYILAPGDVLEIQILNKPKLNTKQEIGPNGKISLPLIEERVYIAGMSLSSFEVFVKETLGKHILKPDIVVYLTPRTIHVVQHFLKTDTIVYKDAATIDEAKAYVGEGYTKEIHYGDTIFVDVGTTPSWWDNNWVAVIAALAVIVSIAVNLR